MKRKIEENEEEKRKKLCKKYMALDITEKQGKLDVINSANNLDKPLCDNLIEPLPNYSGFQWIIAGQSGTGKTSLLLSLLTQKSKKGEAKRSYRKLFDHIIVVSPTLGSGKSNKKDPLADLPEEQKFKDFNYQTMRQVYDMCEEWREDDEHTLVIFDDVTSQLKKDYQAMKLLGEFSQNRRHIYTSIFLLTQKWTDVPLSVRANCSHFSSYRPKNNVELEAICSEMMPFLKKHWLEIMNYIFTDEDRFAFLLADMSMKKSNKVMFYNKFNRLLIEDPSTGINC
jgi:hypothetical protein